MQRDGRIGDYCTCHRNTANQALGAAGVDTKMGGLLGSNGDSGMGGLLGDSGGVGGVIGGMGSGLLGGGGGKDEAALMWSIDGTILRFERDGDEWEMSYIPTANIGL